jgi:hypothetical protein
MHTAIIISSCSPREGCMDIHKVTGTDVVGRSAFDNSRDFIDQVKKSAGEPEQQQAREEMKGANIDVKA